MKLPLSRTREKWLHQTRGFLIDRFAFQKTIDLRNKHQLEDSMGFRGQFDEHRRFQFDILKAQGLKPHHRFLELGCGPLTVGLPLIDYLDQGNYIGVDIRCSVLDLAWREIGSAGLSVKNPTLICSDCFASDALAEASKFDFVYSFSVLFHLSDELLDAYFGSVSRRLKPSGLCLVNVSTELASDRWLEFPFLKRSVSDYSNFAAKHRLLAENLGPIKDHGFKNFSAERENLLLKINLAD
jgi:SAM-dependent methyltransferase